MTYRSGVGRGPIFLSLFVAILALVVVILMGWWWCPRHPQPCRPEHQMVINYEHTATWIPINNTFSPPADPLTDPWEFRNGLLIQLGEFVQPPPFFGDWIFSSVTLEKDGVVLPDGTFPKGEFYWINIVSEGGGWDLPPVGNRNEYGLFHPEMLGDPPTTPRMSTFPTECAQAFNQYPRECLRDGKIHQNFNVAGIITYWQGRKGYEMSAFPEVGKDNLHNRYRFFLKDDFRIEVYKEDFDGVANTPWKTFTSGQVDSIMINGVENTTIPSGDNEDPPWPPPKPRP